MTVIEGTNFTISLEEPVLSIWEGNLQSGLAGQGWHRYQIIRVIRNDRHEDCRIDMGRVEEWPDAHQFFLGLGFIYDIFGNQHLAPVSIPPNMVKRYEPLHKVEELIGELDELRYPSPEHISRNLVPDMTPDKIAAYFEDRSNWAKRKSTFGYGGERIRSL